MSSISERYCSLLVHNDKPASFAEIKEALEGNDSEAKITAMKKAVMAILNGEQLPQLFITIVRYVLPSDDHAIQKLLLLYLASSLLCMQTFIILIMPVAACEFRFVLSSGGTREDRCSRKAVAGDGKGHTCANYTKTMLMRLVELADPDLPKPEEQLAAPQ